MDRTIGELSAIDAPVMDVMHLVDEWRSGSDAERSVAGAMRGSKDEIRPVQVVNADMKERQAVAVPEIEDDVVAVLTREALKLCERVAVIRAEIDHVVAGSPGIEVGHRVPAVAAIKDERIGPCAAGEDVMSGAAGESVVARGSEKLVACG